MINVGWPCALWRSRSGGGAGKLQRFDCLGTGPVKSLLYSPPGDSQVLFWVSLGMLEGGERSESPCSRGYLGCAEITPLFPLPYEEDPGEATLKNQLLPFLTFTFTHYKKWLNIL